MDEIVTKTEDGLLSVLKPIADPITVVNGKYYNTLTAKKQTKKELREEIKAWETTRDELQLKLQEAKEYILRLKALKLQADTLNVIEEKTL